MSNINKKQTFIRKISFIQYYEIASYIMSMDFVGFQKTGF